MFTVLVQKDNSVVVTERQRIMQNSKLIDVFQIVVPKLYDDVEMEKFLLVLEYLTPINHRHNFLELEVADANYKNDFLLYKLKLDTNLTSEVGNVQFMISFFQVEMTDEGKVETPVRKTDVFTMKVIPIADWFVDPSDCLSALDQRIIVTQQNIKAMADLQSTLALDKLDDIKLDIESKKIYGTSGGEKKGLGIDLNDLGDAIADNTSNGMVVVNTYDEEETGNGTT